jgi:hypothetical protein
MSTLDVIASRCGCRCRSRCSARAGAGAGAGAGGVAGGGGSGGRGGGGGEEGEGKGQDDPLYGVFEDPSGEYSIDSLRKHGTVGWPVVPEVLVLVPIYTKAKKADGKMVSVVYSIMEAIKLVHASLW